VLTTLFKRLLLGLFWLFQERISGLVYCGFAIASTGEELGASMFPDLGKLQHRKFPKSGD
jgi:hypothetical protein